MQIIICSKAKSRKKVQGLLKNKKVMFGNPWMHVTTWAILHLPANVEPMPLSISLQQSSRCIGSETHPTLISQSPKQLPYCCQTMYDKHNYVSMQSYIGCCSCIVCCNCNDCCSCTVSWSCWPPVCSINWEYTYSSILCFARATCCALPPRWICLCFCSPFPP